MSKLALWLVPLLAASTASAVVLVNQNFDAIGPSGTAAPSGWVVGHLSPVKNRDVNWVGTSIVGESLIVDNGSATGASNGESYNYGTTGAADRALGNIPRTGNGDHLIQTTITNTNNYALDSLTISYWGEQWHRGESKAASQPEKLRVYWGFDPVTSFNRINALDFAAPQNINGQPQLTLDGNAAANRTYVTATTAVSIGPGQTFYVRWYDYNDDATLDHGLAIDDVVISATPEPASLCLLAVGGLALLRRRCTSRACDRVGC